MAPRRQRVLLHPLSRVGRGARWRGALPPLGVLPPAGRRCRGRPADLPAGGEGTLARSGPESRRPLARDRRRPHVRSDRPLPAGPRGGNAAGAGRPGSAGDLRRRGRPRPAVPAHQPRRTDLPALSGGPGAARTGGLAGDRAAASGCRARRVPDHRFDAGAELPGTSRVAAASRRPRGERGPRGGPAHDRVAVRPLGRMGRRRGVLRLHLLHRAADGLPPRAPGRHQRALAAGGRRSGSEPVRGAAGQLSLAGRHRGDDVRRPPQRGCRATAPIRCISAGTAASTSA